MRITHLSLVHRAWDTRIFEKECRATAAAGHATHLVIGGPAQRAPVAGVQLHSIAASGDRPRGREQWWRMVRITRHALALRPSTFHLHDPHLIPLGLGLKALGQRVVYDRHEDYPAHARSKLAGHPLRSRLKAALWAGLERLAARRFDGFVCASPAPADPSPAERTIVVGTFPLRRTFPRPPLGVDERSNTLIYIGSITAIRGFEGLVRAFETLSPALD